MQGVGGSGGECRLERINLCGFDVCYQYYIASLQQQMAVELSHACQASALKYSAISSQFQLFTNLSQAHPMLLL